MKTCSPQPPAHASMEGRGVAVAARKEARRARARPLHCMPLSSVGNLAPGLAKVNDVVPMARRVDLMRLIIAALVLCANVPSAEGFFGNLVGRLTKSAGHKLFDAASDGNLEDVQALLGSGTGPDDYTDPSHGSSALIMASEGGFIEVVYNLLEAGADPNFARSDGATALMGAAALGHLEVVKLLLYRGSLPDAQDSNGTSALMFASHRGDFHVCNLLLQHGASVNLQNND
ncbi:MAG: ankyrin repeat domain-containing protein, partial [Promethearchaeia archaeon]